MKIIENAVNNALHGLSEKARLAILIPTFLAVATYGFAHIGIEWYYSIRSSLIDRKIVRLEKIVSPTKPEI